MKYIEKVMKVISFPLTNLVDWIKLRPPFSENVVCLICNNKVWIITYSLRSITEINNVILGKYLRDRYTISNGSFFNV